MSEKVFPHVGSLGDLAFSDIKQTPEWREARVEKRAEIINQYYAERVAALLGTPQDTDENRQFLEDARRGALYAEVPSLPHPEDIGNVENIANAILKSLSFYKEMVYYRMILNDPEKADRYRNSLRHELPTREGAGKAIGAAAGFMLPLVVLVVFVYIIIRGRRRRADPIL